MAQRQGQAKMTRVLGRGMPDPTMHLPPTMMFVIGGIGVVGGGAANIWQMYTTISAAYQMFTGVSSPPIDFSNIIFDICFVIAFSFQYALMMLVFRISTQWKRQQSEGKGGKRRGSAVGVRGYGLAAVEVIQQLGLFAIWIGLAFIIDTLGDYNFVGSKVPASADPSTQAFLIFLYAVALYALSTLAFARAWEYMWAGFAAAEHWKRSREGHSSHSRSDQPKWG
jgi:hypothetical protein